MKDCTRGYCTVEANDWQTRSIAWPLCDSTASCYMLQLHCLKTTGPLQLMWHNFTNSQYLHFWQRERPYSILNWHDKNFWNWLRTSCVVAITTVAIWHPRAAYFWVDFEQLIINSTKLLSIATSSKTIVGLCQGQKTALQTLVVTFNTAHFSGRNIEVLSFLFIQQRKLWNNAYLRIAMVTTSTGRLLQKQLSSNIEVQLRILSIHYLWNFI